MAKVENAEYRNKSSRQPKEVCHNNQVFVSTKSMQITQKHSCNNSQLYHDIKCEEGREGCRDILKLCHGLVKVEEKKECCDFSKLCRDE